MVAKNLASVAVVNTPGKHYAFLPSLLLSLRHRLRSKSANLRVNRR